MVTIEDFEKALECCDIGFRGCKECPFGEVCSIEDVLCHALTLATLLKLQRNHARKQFESAMAEQTKAKLERDEALKARDLARRMAEDALAEKNKAMDERDEARADLVETKLAAEKGGDSQNDADRQTRMAALDRDLLQAGGEISRLKEEKRRLIQDNEYLETTIHTLLAKRSQLYKQEAAPVVWQKAGGSFRCSGCGFMPRFTNILEIRFCPHCGQPATVYEAAMPEEGTISSV